MKLKLLLYIWQNQKLVKSKLSENLKDSYRQLEFDYAYQISRLLGFFRVYITGNMEYVILDYMQIDPTKLPIITMFRIQN